MESFSPHGVTLVEEQPCISATPFVLATLRRCQNFGYEIVTITVADAAQQQLFEAGGLIVRSISIELQKLDDFVNIIFDELSAHPANKRIVYVDSCDHLLRFLGIDKGARQLYMLSRATPLIARLFYDAWTELELLRIHSVCTRILRFSTHDGLCICKMRVEKKDGVFSETMGQFVVNPSTLSIETRIYESPTNGQTVVTKQAAKTLLPRTTFDMGLELTVEERRAKTSTQLPFTHAQNQEGLVSLNINAGKKIRAGGQIIYTPDAEDDLEDSDPDDDLMI